MDNIREQIVEQDILEIRKQLRELKEKIEGKTFVVSGGAGFLGSWFCEVALSFEAHVICVDNLIASTNENIAKLRRSPNFTFINSAIESANIPDGADYVVHMASIASPPLYQRSPIETLNSGVLGTIKLLEYSRINKVCTYLLTSTSEVYGDPPDDQVPTDETYPGIVYSYGPRSMYDESKRVAEAYCYAYKDLVQFRIARIFNTYGPKIDTKSPSQYGRALIKFVNQAINNDPITVYDEGQATRSFCYVTDQIVGLYKLLLTDHLDGEVVNIGNDEEISILDLAREIKQVSQSSSDIVLNTEPTYNLEYDPKRRCPNLEKARSLLGFIPNIPLDEGLRRTIEWTRAI
jgi:UDP-glucuronate decarboxylase